MSNLPSCPGWPAGQLAPSEIICPPIITYPRPPDPVDLLFIGWNPPTDKHFWNNADDNLRAGLKWVLGQLGWRVEPDLLAEFERRHAYFVHAVKCWMRVKKPNRGVTRTCAKQVLQHEIEILKPRVIVALGEIPHLALTSIEPFAHVVPRFRGMRYGEGWCGAADSATIIVTAFPNQHGNVSGGTNRDQTVRALRRWLPESRT
jgi:uracil-DNA glycosylase